jgi:hypothetical protein
VAKKSRRPTRYASPLEVAEQAPNWTDAQLTCRLKKHRFTEPVTAFVNTRYGYVFTRMACAGGCGVEQLQEANLRGHVYWSTLDYSNAPGYLSRSGRIAGDARDQVNLEYINRVIQPDRTRRDEPPHRKWED